MEDIVLKWYCNKAKFRQIMALRVSYRETLGKVFNTTWELEIENSELCSEFTWDIYLRNDVCDEEIKFYCRIVSNGQIKYAKTATFFHSKDARKFIDVHYLKDLVDYNLDIFFMFKNKSKIICNLEEEFQFENLNHLSNSLQNMFEKEHMTDIVLKCDSVALKAHKNILSAQSPVFEAMFMSPMRENELDTVVIEDIEPSVFQVMVSFMYSGRVKVMSETMACDLLYAAEKYQIEALKEGCMEYLKSILSSENAIKILEISNLFDKQFKLHCLHYIKNQFEELKSTKDWIDLKQKNPSLALEVYSHNERE